MIRSLFSKISFSRSRLSFETYLNISLFRSALSECDSECDSYSGVSEKMNETELSIYLNTLRDVWFRVHTLRALVKSRSLYAVVKFFFKAT